MRVKMEVLGEPPASWAALVVQLFEYIACLRAEDPVVVVVFLAGYAL